MPNIWDGISEGSLTPDHGLPQKPCLHLICPFHKGAHNEPKRDKIKHPAVEEKGLGPKSFSKYRLRPS